MGNRAIDVIFFDLGDTLVRTADKTWLPGAKALLETLQHSGVRLGIISNTANLPNRQAILALLPHDFDLTRFEEPLILFSSEVGIAKPNKEIYALAVGRSGIEASRCLFCSEDAVDTLVAQSLGMRSLRTITGSDDLTRLPAHLASAAGS